LVFIWSKSVTTDLSASIHDHTKPQHFSISMKLAHGSTSVHSVPIKLFHQDSSTEFNNSIRPTCKFMQYPPHSSHNNQIGMLTKRRTKIQILNLLHAEIEFGIGRDGTYPLTWLPMKCASLARSMTWRHFITIHWSWPNGTPNPIPKAHNKMHTKPCTKSTQQNPHQTLQERHIKPYNIDTPNPWRNNNNKQTKVALNVCRKHQRQVLST
jgi:hypothetical protein